MNFCCSNSGGKILHDLTNGLGVLTFLLPFLDLRLEAMHLPLKRCGRTRLRCGRRSGWGYWLIRTRPSRQFERAVYHLLGLGELLLLDQRLKILHDLTNGLGVFPFLLPFLDLRLEALHLSLQRWGWPCLRRWPGFAHECKSSIPPRLRFGKLVLLQKRLETSHQVADRLRVRAGVLLYQSLKPLHLLVNPSLLGWIVLAYRISLRNRNA